MMLAIVRPDLNCVISEAGPIDFSIVAQRAPAGYLENIFGPDTNWWNPTARWTMCIASSSVPS